MHEARTFLQDLALVFCVATLATLVFQRLRQPVVLGYLLAGIIVGPNVAIPLFADPVRIHTLSELGVILVMFSLGLEFSIARLVRLLPTAGFAGLVQITAMMWLGYTVGRLFGLGWRESLFIGGMVCISSTMIVARVFAAQKVEDALQDSVFGILVVQDLAAILLITIFTAVATGAGLPASEVAATVGQLALFVTALVAVGMLVIPPLIREAHHRASAEILLVASVGVCFGLALLAEYFGYSVALGAFAGGVLVGESGRRVAVEHLIAPLREVFAAVFFVSIGMLVDPAAIADNAALIATLTAVVVLGQSLFISLGTFLAGKSIRLSVRTGMSLAQIGEFSFIIVGVGAAAGVVSSDLYAVAVGVAVITTFFTPLLVRASERVALGVERRLPHPVQTFAALYAAWFESLRAGPRPRSRVRRQWILFAVDALVLIAIVLGAAIGHAWFAGAAERRFELSPSLARSAVLAGAVALSVPFAIGLARTARSLGLTLARRALPEQAGLDLAAAPRRAFVVSLQLALIALVVFPLIAVSQPFLPLYYGVALIAGVGAVMGIAFWRSATNLEGHLRAGAQIVLEVLDRQRSAEAGPASPLLAELLPGLGPLVSRPIGADSPAVGKTLAELNLRGLTGATVIAIKRADGDVVSPTGKEELHPGDLLSLTGSEESIEAADRLLAADGASRER